MSEALKTYIVDKIREQKFISAPMIAANRNQSLQYIGRVLNLMVDDGKLRYVGKVGSSKYYVLPRSHITLPDVERAVLAKNIMPQAWMGAMRSPTEFITLLDRKKQATARRLFDSDDPDYYDYFNEILPAIEMLCYGRRGNNVESDLDMARAKVSLYAERIDMLNQFLRMFLDNEHIKNGAFAEALSDYGINNYRSNYTREAS